MASGLTSLPQSPFAQILYVALVDSVGLSLFTYCLGPVSGAHLSKYTLLDRLQHMLV